MAGEQFRKLRVKLRALKTATGGSLVSVVVTSPLMGEGKTACAANLAVTLSREKGSRVLLVDCDARKPRIHEFLEVMPDKGLLEVLDGECTADEAAIAMPGGTLEVISMATAFNVNGHGRATELPMQRFKECLKGLTSRYDFIVVDAPPLLPTADAGGLVNICDGALLVVRAGATPRPAVTRALASMDKNKLIGFLLNDVPEKGMGRYYYKYYSDKEPEKKK
jgi:receptor protein-tyrosine kinase